MSLDHYTVKDAPEGHELHHPHELSLCKVGDDDDGEQVLKCGLCEEDVVDRKRSGDVVYVCKSSCGYVLHNSCGDLPLQINHSFHHHPSHHGPLSLITDPSCLRCYSCLKYKNCLYYGCSECKFRMDPECALMMPTRGEEESIQHITHPHPLLLLLLHADEYRYCRLCYSKISGGEEAYYYGCTHCNYFLHKSCAHFPPEFPQHHPLHPHHSLSLFIDYNYGNFTCNICERYKLVWIFHFKCDDHQCSFRMCWKCIITVERKKNIKYEDHDHLLCYVDDHKQIDNCNAYDAYCTRPDLININIGDSMEFKRTASSMFKCLDCDFRLHFLCGPLPSTIKHHSHIHYLTLLDSLIEDDFGEYYCDVCETQRDPRIRLYHCHECKFFAHVHCIISEIAKVLRGDLEGVELNALGNDYWRRHPTELETTSFTLMDLIHQIPHEDEKYSLKKFYKWYDASSPVNVGIVSPKQREFFLNDYKEIDKILQLSRFDATNFQTLMDEFDEYRENEKLELKSSDLGLKMVKVKGYMIPYPLAGVLQTLLHEYRDIANDEDFETSLEMKSFAYFILCQTVKRMRATLVKDVTKHLLQEWYCHLVFVSLHAFEIGFACQKFDRLVDAYLGLQAETLEEKIPNLLKLRISEMQLGLKKCEEYKGSSKKSEYMKYCLEKASKSRWLNSFDCSIKDEDAQSSAIQLPHGKWEWERL